LAEYPQSNGRAELAMKTAKRNILEKTTRGSLNSDKAACVLLQYRNTPIQSFGLSPAQLLFHRQLRDHFPSILTHYWLHKKWMISAKKTFQHPKRSCTLQQAYTYTRTKFAYP